MAKVGRPPKPEKERLRNVTVGLTQDEADAALHIAIRLGIPRRVWMHQILRDGIVLGLRTIARHRQTRLQESKKAPNPGSEASRS